MGAFVVAGVSLCMVDGFRDDGQSDDNVNVNDNDDNVKHKVYDKEDHTIVQFLKVNSSPLLEAIPSASQRQKEPG
ncbi:hypothetical protein N7467_007873 [Penicillium canescens]|nr:hypothetical protein N7467_007873 [Penicillium canescens]